MLDVLIDALVDSLKMLPFLFVAYLLIEYLEHKASAKMKSSLQRLGPFGPVGGALLGVVPQDEQVFEYDCDGVPTVKLPEDSPVRKALYQIIDNLDLS